MCLCNIEATSTIRKKTAKQMPKSLPLIIVIYLTEREQGRDPDDHLSGFFTHIYLCSIKVMNSFNRSEMGASASKSPSAGPPLPPYPPEVVEHCRKHGCQLKESTIDLPAAAKGTSSRQTSTRRGYIVHTASVSRGQLPLVVYTISSAWNR